MYSRTIQRLLCYFFRVRDGHFEDLERDMFKVTDMQDRCADNVDRDVSALIKFMNESSKSSQGARRSKGSKGARSSPSTESTPGAKSDPGYDAELERFEACVDQSMLVLLVSLIQHRLPESEFDSVMLSFCAALAWDQTQQTWMKENEFGSLLSHIIYCVQLVVILYARSLVEKGEHEEMQDGIQEMQKTWLANNTRGPIARINAIRLYAMAVGRSSVTPAQIRWNAEGTTLFYGAFTYEVGFLAQEIGYYLDHARIIFQRDLCLGLPDVPQYDLTALQDNWDSRKPGHSFILDPRNEELLEGGAEWLLENVRARPDISGLMFHQHRGSSEWHVRPDFASQYEDAIQQFLEYMAPLLHKGSGQPGRRREFSSLTWQNVGMVKRNLLLHDGYMLFLLTYHKAQARSHASRYPARFVLPAAASLLVQFLVLITPVREFFATEVQIPSCVSAYLWSSGEKIWPDERFTKVMKQKCQESIGIELHIQAWRQVAAGIAIKVFGRLFVDLGDFHEPGDADDEMEGLPIADMWSSFMDIFHHQAARGPRIGNQVYGGSINFNAGLTDAGLQQYFKASKLWHTLCHPAGSQRPRVSPTDLTVGHRRPLSSMEMPLTKRVALHDVTPRHRRRWTMHDAQLALQRLYPHRKPATFRSTS